jgi:hypothetical protein
LREGCQAQAGASMHTTETTQGERALIAALEAGRSFTPEFYREWCPSEDLDPEARVIIEASFLRALIFVEGAHLCGLELPWVEANYLRTKGVDPTRRRVSSGLSIDWSSDGVAVQEADVLEAVTDIEDEDERAMRLRHAVEWGVHHHMENRPVIAGELDLSDAQFPARLVLNAVVLRRIGSTRKLSDIASDISLHLAQFADLSLTGTSVKNLKADGLSTTGDVDATNLEAESVSIKGGHIGGELCLRGAKIHGDEVALDAARIKVGQGVYLDQGFEVTGEISFHTASIDGNISLSSARIEGKTDVAFNGQSLRVGGIFFLNEKFRSKGQIKLLLCEVKGPFLANSAKIETLKDWALDCSGGVFGSLVQLQDNFFARGFVSFSNCTIQSYFSASTAHIENKDRAALILSGSKVSQDVSLNQNFKVEGRVELRSAQIGGHLSFESADISDESGIAIDCETVHVAQALFLRRGFKAKGQVRLLGANIGLVIDARGGEISNPGKLAINLIESRVGMSVELCEDLKILGNIDASGAKIGRDLTLSGCHIETGTLDGSEEAAAIICKDAQIAGSVYLNDQLAADDLVDFSEATIGGNFEAYECNIVGKPCALRLADTVIENALIFKHPRKEQNHDCSIVGTIDLSDARCNTLHDASVTTSRDKAWKHDGELILDGFKYGRLGPDAPSSWKERKAWLDKQPAKDRKGLDFKPQPFEQLASVLREMGHTAAAREVGVSKQFRSHFSGNVRGSAFWFRFFLLAPAGYGYRPGIPALIGFVLMLASYPLFESAYRQGYMTPAQPHAAILQIADILDPNAAPDECQLAEEDEIVPPFHGAVFVVDTFVPLIDLDQETSWKPSSIPRCVTGLDSLVRTPLWLQPEAVTLFGFTVMEPVTLQAITAPIHAFARFLAESGWLFGLKWMLMIAGFAISGVIAASLSGVIRRD